MGLGDVAFEAGSLGGVFLVDAVDAGDAFALPDQRERHARASSGISVVLMP